MTKLLGVLAQHAALYGVASVILCAVSDWPGWACLLVVLAVSGRVGVLLKLWAEADVVGKR